MSVRWGISTSTVSSLAGAKKNGFDWCYLPLDLIMEMSSDQFTRFRDKSRKHGYEFDICALDLPDDVIITQKGFNVYVWMEYLKKGVIRLAELGCRGLVWSNGPARILPEEGDVMGAKEQVAQFLFMLCELSEQYNIDILIEPLDTSTTNFLNTVEETVDFLGPIGKDNLSISIAVSELSVSSFEVEALNMYKDLIHMIRLEDNLQQDGDTSAIGERNKQLLENLKLSVCRPRLLLPGNTGNLALDFCKSFLIK